LLLYYYHLLLLHNETGTVVDFFDYRRRRYQVGRRFSVITVQVNPAVTWHKTVTSHLTVCQNSLRALNLLHWKKIIL